MRRETPCGQRRTGHSAPHRGRAAPARAPVRHRLPWALGLQCGKAFLSLRHSACTSACPVKNTRMPPVGRTRFPASISLAMAINLPQRVGAVYASEPGCTDRPTSHTRTGGTVRAIQSRDLGGHSRASSKRTGMRSPVSGTRQRGAPGTNPASCLTSPRLQTAVRTPGSLAPGQRQDTGRCRGSSKRKSHVPFQQGAAGSLRLRLRKATTS